MVAQASAEASIPLCQDHTSARTLSSTQLHATQLQTRPPAHTQYRLTVPFYQIPQSQYNGRILIRRRSVPLTPTSSATSSSPNTTSLELLTIHNAFHQGQFPNVLSFPTSTLSPENKITAQVLALRARIAQGDVGAVIDELEGDEEPELKAVKAFAELKAGKMEEAVAAIEELVGSSADNAVVQVLGGSVLHQAGKSEEAVQLLSKHQGNLEAYV